jgi:hypothetical protein
MSSVSVTIVYVDYGLSGTNRDRPGLRLGLGRTVAARRCAILGELTKRNVKLGFGGSIHNPTDLWEGCCSTCWR